MKRKNILLLLFTIVMASIIVYSFQGAENPKAYIKRILKERKEKDRFMRNDNESPFANQRNEFQGLKYFDPDPKYKVTAKLSKVANPKIINLATSDGKSKDYLEFGYASFEIDGQKGELQILEGTDEEGYLFLAFGDATSAIESYGAGRYMDVSYSGNENSILLDFNLAYNPYCAYSENFSCPLPPRSNLLAFPIKAGEKTYQKL